MDKPNFIYKGWLGVAPIYLAEDMYNIETRHPIFDPLLSLSVWIVQTTNDLFDTEYPFTIRITGMVRRHPAA